MNEIFWIMATCAGGAAGAVLLRRSWRARAASPVPWVVAGWLVLALTVILAGATMGAARGVFVALALIPLAALTVVAGGLEVRQARGRAGRSLAPEPNERPSTWWRGTARWLLAGPIGLVAAMGVGVFYVTWAGGADQTRLVIGVLIVPAAWAACMAWTLADNRILRATAVLAGVAVFGFGLSILRGFS